MHPNVLPPSVKKVLTTLSHTDFIKAFYLSGGTALALHIGHRESQDLDFFSQKNFNPQRLQAKLEKLGPLSGLQLDQGTLNCFLDDVKLQFLHYPYKLLKPKIKWQTISLSHQLDIACTKLLTVASRGNKKDFVDIYFLLHDYDLNFLLGQLKRKYPNTDYNIPHILKSLVYFSDADHRPMPRLHRQVSWQQVKNSLINKIKNYQL